MSMSVEMTGKTVEEAIESALLELGIEREQAQIEILETPKKGTLGLFGNRDARVRVSRDCTPESVAEAFLTNIFEKMHLDATVKAEKNEDEIHAEINEEENIGI